ncbi:hypothetical protein J2S25_003916 [Mesobacillus stamsii]|uniref:Uncharacterized protein n=1 Tax=Mesobacillus stamsii TaxID=225347 RepID=A0ABU0G285_9BACI|nr:hypothetical protein [Mesobacillus stamsii]
MWVSEHGDGSSKKAGIPCRNKIIWKSREGFLLVFLLKYLYLHHCLLFTRNSDNKKAWPLPLGYLMDLWECHKQFTGMAKPMEDLSIDDVIPVGI